MHLSFGTCVCNAVVYVGLWGGVMIGVNARMGVVGQHYFSASC